ncbi:MAG: TerC family protein [Rhodospirillales bacterium]|nr:TerC family protein [Rhodospirillales bacterium]MCB9996993.1 TerC family protein [Rhodospirillales bacterium]
MDLISILFDVTIGEQPLIFWAGFLTLILALMVFDLSFLNRRDHEAGVGESLKLASLYFGIACAFGVWVWVKIGPESGMDFFTAYLVEQSLSLDNIFVMSLIFGYFGVPAMYQHRVLFWGIIGVIVFRAIMIGAGLALVHRFDWILLVFAAFLIFTGIKLLLSEDEHPAIEENRIIKFLKKYIPVTTTINGHDFFVKERHKKNGKFVAHATPLFLALVTIECADVIFAFDSVPAVFAITTDTFIAYTSNIFAIIGLRAMYFVLTAIIHRFSYMNYALSLILVIIGLKAFYAEFTGGHVPSWLSLSLTLGILVGGFALSFLKTKAEEKKNQASS